MPTEPTRWRPRRALALALAAGAALTGCRVMGATTTNLDALHNDDSTHKREAALVSHWEYVIRRLVGGALAEESSREFVQNKAPKAYKAPHKECLERLIELGRYSPRNLENSGRQIEWFARLAVEDPWRLSRERAVLELGSAGRRLVIDRPVSLSQDVKPATSVEVGAVLAQMTRALQQLLARGTPKEEPTVAFAEACDAMGALRLDLSGARRALRILTDVYSFVDLEGGAREALERASLHVQREAVRQALAAALRDPEPIVRAAAAQASVEAVGRAVLDVLILQVRAEEDPVVLRRVLDLVGEYGLPREEEVGELDLEDVRHDWYRSLYRLAVFHPDGGVRAGAMLALRSITDRAVESLREEDWQDWWRDYLAARRSAEAETAGG